MFNHPSYSIQSIQKIFRTYPCRVFLIMGNRDINKMRLAAELSDSAMRQSSDEAFQAWWDPKAPALTKYLSSKGRRWWPLGWEWMGWGWFIDWSDILQDILMWRDSVKNLVWCLVFRSVSGTSYRFKTRLLLVAAIFSVPCRRLNRAS